MSKLVGDRPRMTGREPVEFRVRASQLGRASRLGQASRLGTAVTACSMLALSLSGCAVAHAVNPVNWFSSKPQPDPDAGARNGGNLQQGSNEAYPSLSSVPGPPMHALTDDQKKALTRALIADRDHANYADTQIADSSQTPTPDLGNMAMAGADMPGAAPPPDAAPAPPAEPSGGPQVDAAAGPPPEPVGGPQAEAAGGPQADPNNMFADAFGDSQPHRHHHHHGDANATLPQESTLTPPAPPAEPSPEATVTPPPQAQLAPPPPPKAVQPMAPVAAGAAATPDLGTPAAPQIAAAPVAAPTPGVDAAALATATFQGDAGNFSMPPGSLQHIVQSFNFGGGHIHIVAYAEPVTGPGDTSSQELAHYQSALAHAEAVKRMLVAKGIPAANITTRAATRAGAGNTADVALDP